MRNVTTARPCEIALESENNRVNTVEALCEILSTMFQRLARAEWRGDAWASLSLHDLRSAIR
jgi:hypothetical protein